MTAFDYKWSNKANKSASICIYGGINNGLGKNHLDCYPTLKCPTRLKKGREFVNYNLYNRVNMNRESQIDWVG